MAAITPEQMAHFEEHGYLLVKGLFDPKGDLDPILDEYAGVLDNLANELYAKGEITSTYSDPAAWETLWRETRDRLAADASRPFNRWSAEHPVCA